MRIILILCGESCRPPILTDFPLLCDLPGPSRSGDENYFGYSYGSENLPKGKWELYSWTTGRFGKGTGSYSAFDLKQEVEYGVTDRFQIALEWKENHTYFTGGAGQESADSNTPVWRNRFSNETEWERPRPSHGESFTTNFKPEIHTGVTYRL